MIYSSAYTSCCEKGKRDNLIITDNKSNSQSTLKEAAQESFFSILVNDVGKATRLAERSNDQSDRRTLLRSMIAGIEGISWIYREHIRSISENLDPISPVMELAFSETSYFVDEKGNLSEQPRFIATTAMIRLTTNVAVSLCDGLDVDFGDVGWANLKTAIATRNRITHPKKATDLEISSDEMKTALNGFYWLLELVVRVMEETNKSSAEFLAELRKVVAQLKEEN